MPSLRDSIERMHSSSKKKKRKESDRNYDRHGHRSRSRKRSRERRSRDRYDDRRDRRRNDGHSNRGKYDYGGDYESATHSKKHSDRSENNQNDQQINDFLNSLAPQMKSNQNTEDQTVKRKRKSRWMATSEVVGVPTVLPPNLTPLQEKAFLLQLKIEEFGKRLITGKLGIPEKVEDRSPSPEPIYNNLGIRMNTREVRTRKRLEEQRYAMIAELIKINPEYRPPLDYRPLQQKYIDKVWIPQEAYPTVNFVGLIIGPRGNTLKQLEKETGAKIIIRGKGSMKEGKIGRPDGQPLPGADEPLHAYITATTEDCLKKAMDLVTKILKEAVTVPETENELRKNQLKQLALLNGTLRGEGAGSLSALAAGSASVMALIGGAGGGNRCSNCGSEDHKTWACPEGLNLTASTVCGLCGGIGHLTIDCKMVGGTGGEGGLGPETALDREYMSLMAELGQNSVLDQPLSAGTAKLNQLNQIIAAQQASAPRKLESIAPLVKRVLDSKCSRSNMIPNPSPLGPCYSTNPMYSGGTNNPPYPSSLFTGFSPYPGMGLPMAPPLMNPFPMNPMMAHNTDQSTSDSQNSNYNSYMFGMSNSQITSAPTVSDPNSNFHMNPPWLGDNSMQSNNDYNFSNQYNNNNACNYAPGPDSDEDNELPPQPILPPPPPPSLTGFSLDPLPPPPAPPHDLDDCDD